MSADNTETNGPQMTFTPNELLALLRNFEGAIRRQVHTQYDLGVLGFTRGMNLEAFEASLNEDVPRDPVSSVSSEDARAVFLAIPDQVDEETEWLKQRVAEDRETLAKHGIRLRV